MTAETRYLADDQLTDLLCVADTKWVLGHWYIKAMQNGRSLTDFNALAAMAQDQLGHTRALFGLLEQSHGLPQNQLEFERDVEQVHSMDALDAPPQNWADFILTTWLVEHALVARFRAVGSRLASVEALEKQCRREAEFHIMYLEGSLEGFSQEEIEAGKRALQVRAPLVARWLQDLGGVALAEHGARLARQLEAWRGDTACSSASEPLPSGGWDTARRRPKGSRMPATLWEFVLPTNEQAAMCRRPLMVSTDDGIRFSTGG